MNQLHLQSVYENKDAWTWIFKVCTAWALNQRCVWLFSTVVYRLKVAMLKSYILHHAQWLTFRKQTTFFTITRVTISLSRVNFNESVMYGRRPVTGNCFVILKLRWGKQISEVEKSSQTHTAHYWHGKFSLWKWGREIYHEVLGKTFHENVSSRQYFGLFGDVVGDNAAGSVSMMGL